MAEENIDPKHFVLVHGVCHGAWCWYKLKPLLESSGHEVTAINLAASGINTNKIEDVHTFSEYSKPLLDFLTSLAPNEKVVLVGHSFGGLSIALAMDNFPEKIQMGVFLTAHMPDTQHKPSYVSEQFIERYPVKEWLDCELSSRGSKTSLLFGHKFLSTKLYQLCSTEDLELAKTLIMPGLLFSEELYKAKNFSKEGYGSVPRAFIVCNEDLVYPLEFQQWMIQNAGIDVVREIKEADHMAMLSKPQELCSSLLELANKSVEHENPISGTTICEIKIGIQSEEGMKLEDESEDEEENLNITNFEVYDYNPVYDDYPIYDDNSIYDDYPIYGNYLTYAENSVYKDHPVYDDHSDRESDDEDLIKEELSFEFGYITYMNKVCYCVAEAHVLSLLQKCSTLTSLREARQLHALILTTTTSFGSHSPFVYNNILSMYARCGSLRDSHLVFDKMPHRTLVSYNALLAAYSRVSHHAISALKLYTQMEARGLMPSSMTFTSLLQASSLLEDWWIGSSLHAKGLKLDCLNDVCVQTSLLNMYSNCRDLSSAELVFRDMPDRDDVAWNSLIVGYLKNNEIKEGVGLFIAMVRFGFTPTQFTYCMVLNACSRLKDHHSGRLIHAHVIVRNVSPDLHLQNALLDMYCNVGNTQTAYRIFSGMENPDLVSWNSMIAGYSENEDGEKAMNLFVQLQELCFPKPDDYTYAGTISATGAFPSSSYGKPLHAQVTKAGFERSVFVGSTLVSMYFKNHETQAAQRVFDSISAKDVILWTEMITGYCKMTDGMNAIRCFYEMFHEAHEVDDYVLSGVLGACADLAILRQGEIIHCYAVKLGYDVEMSVSGSLIDMYAKNGSLEAAYLVFSQVSDPDLKCWNSMLGGYSHHGMVEEALKLFEEILEQGLVPDQVTFLSLLSTCSHNRLVEQGKFLWNYMNLIGLVPGPKHYSCMVTLLSRAALLEEAEEIIKKSPYIEDNLELWRTLLSACVINKNLNVGVHAAEEVLRLDAKDGPTLVLLSNLYAASGKWDKVAEIRRNMRGLMLEKDPGLSWIEAKNNIHVFSSGDQSHRKADEVLAELQRLKRNMIRTENDSSEAQIQAA
ncbi:pentatricopeptide repeat-containing protein At3g50420 [Gastrolobium bilobum]|uniref:pentatricopeptide repeat-containing protein At3g50420 n=1 Tax=Gastrolobium bilobum TaxID=150636 RepID=UPI002AB2B53E|nr:pentatricopeptide repeat-containing protein At3g50420 [Gastrolobium bilobum]